MNSITITAKQLPAILDFHIETGENVMIWGPPGVGKSQMIKQALDRHALPMIDYRGTTIDSLDVRGLPFEKDGRLHYAPPSSLPYADRDGAKGGLFLDELAASDPAVQKALLQLTLDRCIGDYRLPDDWVIIAAGNRMTDRAGVGRFNSALANRFAHYELVADVDAFCDYAIKQGWPVQIPAFIRFRDELLHQFEPDRLVNATPRSWESVGPIITAGLDPETEALAIAARVGEGVGAEFSGFLRIWRTLPSPDAILMNPDTAPVPDKGNVLYALVGALARKVTENSIDNLVKYLGRIPPEFGVVCMKHATAANAKLTSTAAFIAWSSANSDVYL